jgi:hypothetical protein
MYTNKIIFLFHFLFFIFTFWKNWLRMLILIVGITLLIAFPKSADAVFSAETQLRIEVEKMISAGHLKPGYYSAGMLDMIMDGRAGEAMQDYYHNPAETIYTLAIAYPHLPSNVQSSLSSYMQQEYFQYPLGSITHVGWGSGAERMSSPWPPDFNVSPSTPGIAGTTGNWIFWKFNPFNFYAAWKYVEVTGNASGVFDAIKGQYESPPSNTDYKVYGYEAAHVLNTYIAGHIGYLELEQMATGQRSSTIQNTLNSLISTRLSMLDNINPPDIRGLEASGFAYLVPELGEEMYQNKRSRVQTYVDTYEDIMPYWFEAGADEQIKDPLRGLFAAEGSNTPLYAVNSLFSARAYALKQSRTELEKYIDVPYFEVGDLFYIQNLVAVIRSGPGGPTQPPGTPTPTPTPRLGDANGDQLVDGLDYIIWLNHFGQSTPNGHKDGDFDGSGTVDSADYTIWISNFPSP